jgi:hypothetical protein
MRITRRRRSMMGHVVDPVLIMAVVAKAGVVAVMVIEHVQMAGTVTATVVASWAIGLRSVRASSLLKKKSRPMQPRRKSQAYC